ncbi:MAG: hypothetical protein OXG15_07225 [Gammaproteobacteria bacterium]|nr:hypothetical protein [Gammaproteobacteria bacterium]
MDEDVCRLFGEMHGLHTVLVMAIAADRNVRAAIIEVLPKIEETVRTDPRNWETEMDKVRSEGFLRIIEDTLAKLRGAQETAP